jgi:hypothetical protein
MASYRVRTSNKSSNNARKRKGNLKWQRSKSSENRSAAFARDGQQAPLGVSRTSDWYGKTMLA